MKNADVARSLRKRALSYPETYEEAPWGDRVVKVRGKIFLFCGVHDGQLGLSVKLPRSGRAALTQPNVRPTPYGLGKSGWVSATFARPTRADEQRIAAWIDESYRALAPKRLVAQLGAAEAATATAKKPKMVARAIPARVMLLCLDPLRAARAVRALAERGITARVVADPAAVRRRLKSLDALIVDVGRRQDDGLALAAAIDASDAPIHLFIAGIRDAAARKRAAAAATSADLFRVPPGEPAVADAVAAALQKK